MTFVIIIFFIIILSVCLRERFFFPLVSATFADVLDLLFLLIISMAFLLGFINTDLWSANLRLVIFVNLKIRLRHMFCHLLKILFGWRYFVLIATLLGNRELSTILFLCWLNRVVLIKDFFSCFFTGLNGIIKHLLSN